MLLPAEVLPFLLHEDGDVRVLALEYLADSHDPAPATADDVWAAMDRYGHEPSRYATSQRAVFAAKLPCFPATERSTERLLRALREEFASADAFHLVSAARELPPATLGRLLEDEAIRARLSAETVADIADDLALVETAFDALWEALETCVVGLGDKGTLKSPAFQRAQRVLRVISRSPEQAAARGLEILGDPPPTERAGFWMELFAVLLFGRVRYHGPLDPLLRVLGEDGDYVNERAADALVHVGTPDVVATIEARLGACTEAFGTYAPGVIARIRRPESEAALIRLLEPEGDLYPRTELAMYLLELCTTSPDALRIIETMVEDGEYDPMLLDLDELLVTAGKMVGWSPRDPAAWEAKPKLVRPSTAMAAQLKRLEERRPPAPASRAERRGFVPFGKKARKKQKR